MNAKRSSRLALFTHLRLHYQVAFLSPLFAWGYLLSAHVPSLRALVAFLAFHVFLYGGITAYNSYFDRDQGPVGGLRVPPPVTPGLLPFSVAVQVTGLLMALYVGLAFTLLYLAIVALSVAYSHPRFRWKSRPLLSLSVVAFGQGTAGFVAGWLAGAGTWPPATPLRAVLGAMVATLATVGMYPLTQLYQIEEDRARGDRTFAVAFGIRTSFAFSMVCLVGAGLCLVLLLGSFGVVDALVGALGMALLLSAIFRWYSRSRPEIEANFHAIHWLQFGLSATTLTYVALRLLSS